MADIETTHAQKLENSMSRVKDLEETVQLMKGNLYAQEYIV